ncbi:MAG: hypothetical protein WDA41_07395 [Candidatus Neomarinimicrobiota bacterium]
MPYGVQILLDSVDITNKVSRFEITASMDSYVRELSLDIADPDYHDTFDFSALPEAPMLEVLTRIETSWISQGLFYIEKPTYRVGIHQTETGLWGRSQTAVLGSPFAPKVNKIWDTDTTFFSICAEMCTLCGLTWDSTYSDISDFLIYAYSYQAENIYPIEVLSELAALDYGEDLKVTTDAAGHVCLRLVDRSPSASSATITDPVLSQINEEPEWPDFGNRIKISAAGSLAGYGVELNAPNACLLDDGIARTKLYARVTDPDGLPVNNALVTWSAAESLVTLDAAQTETQTIIIANEEQRATSFTEVDVDWPPESVISIYAYSDVFKTTNLIDDGYEIDGNTIRLTGELSYCDQLLLITYEVEGMAVNYATAGTVAGNDKITADVGGNSASIDIYVGNPCACPPTLTLKANPTSIMIGETAGLLAYVEIGGSPVTDGRLIYMTVDTKPAHGSIDWTSQSLGAVSVTNDECRATNEISGLTRCELSMWPTLVTGVYLSDEDGNKTGANLYSGHTGKLVVLNTTLISGTALLADYDTVGAAVNQYDGKLAGSDTIRAILRTTREEPLEASVSISVGEETEDTCSGLCDSEGEGCAEETATCSAGEAWGKKNGVDGCWPTGDLDACGEGVYCYKDGSLGCYSSGDCDTSHTVSKVHGKKGGTDGCYDPAELDACGDGQVYCYQGGTLGCYDVEECDSTSSVTSSVECSAGTVCCDNKVTGKRGCWPSAQCAASSGGGNQNWNNKPGGDDGEWGSGGGGGALSCNATNCHNLPSEECINGRFADALAMDGCGCEEICSNEFDQFGTTQSNDGSSYRPISQIVVDDYGLVEDSPEYWEKFGELRQAAINDCIEQCDACANATALVLTGSDAVTSPGGYQYTVSGGVTPYAWSVSGVGASIDENGYVSLDESACGAYTVTVTDRCGGSASLTARVTNHGQWYQQPTCGGLPDPYWGATNFGPFYFGDTRVQATLGCCHAGNADGCCGFPGIGDICAFCAGWNETQGTHVCGWVYIWKWEC